jgi:hypothetical protein
VTDVTYVPAFALIVLGLILLGVLIVRLRGVLRLFHQTVSMVATNTQDRTGMLRARSAALRVAVDELRHRPENPVTSLSDAD